MTDFMKNSLVVITALVILAAVVVYLVGVQNAVAITYTLIVFIALGLGFISGAYWNERATKTGASLTNSAYGRSGNEDAINVQSIARLLSEIRKMYETGSASNAPPPSPFMSPLAPHALPPGQFPSDGAAPPFELTGFEDEARLKQD